MNFFHAQNRKKNTNEYETKEPPHFIFLFQLKKKKEESIQFFKNRKKSELSL